MDHNKLEGFFGTTEENVESAGPSNICSVEDVGTLDMFGPPNVTPLNPPNVTLLNPTNVTPLNVSPSNVITFELPVIGTTVKTVEDILNIESIELKIVFKKYSTENFLEHNDRVVVSNCVIHKILVNNLERT